MLKTKSIKCSTERYTKQIMKTFAHNKSGYKDHWETIALLISFLPKNAVSEIKAKCDGLL